MNSKLLTKQSVDTHYNEHLVRRHDYPNENIVRLVGTFFQNQDFFEGRVEVDRSSSSKGLVLDYGCADGNNSRFLLERGFDVCAIDITKESIEKTNQNLNNFDKSRWQTDVLSMGDDKLPYKENQFDYIVSNQVVYFLASRERIDNLLKEFKRVLKPNGRMIISMISRFNTYCFNGTPKGNDIYTYKTSYGEIDIYVTKNESQLHDVFSLFEISEIGYWDNNYDGMCGHHYVVKAFNKK